MLFRFLSESFASSEITKDAANLACGVLKKFSEETISLAGSALSTSDDDTTKSLAAAILGSIKK